MGELAEGGVERARFDGFDPRPTEGIVPHVEGLTTQAKKSADSMHKKRNEIVTKGNISYFKVM